METNQRRSLVGNFLLNTQHVGHAKPRDFFMHLKVALPFKIVRTTICVCLLENVHKYPRISLQNNFREYRDNKHHDHDHKPSGITPKNWSHYELQWAMTPCAHNTHHLRCTTLSKTTRKPPKWTYITMVIHQYWDHLQHEAVALVP